LQENQVSNFKGEPCWESRFAELPVHEQKATPRGSPLRPQPLRTNYSGVSALTFLRLRLCQRDGSKAVSPQASSVPTPLTDEAYPQ
jgi:hypothetical protein